MEEQNKNFLITRPFKAIILKSDLYGYLADIKIKNNKDTVQNLPQEMFSIAFSAEEINSMLVRSKKKANLIISKAKEAKILDLEPLQAPDIVIALEINRKKLIFTVMPYTPENCAKTIAIMHKHPDTTYEILEIDEDINTIDDIQLSNNDINQESKYKNSPIDFSESIGALDNLNATSFNLDNLISNVLESYTLAKNKVKNKIIWIFCEKPSIAQRFYASEMDFLIDLAKRCSFQQKNKYIVSREDSIKPSDLKNHALHHPISKTSSTSEREKSFSVPASFYPIELNFLHIT